MIDHSRRTGAAIEAHYQFLVWLMPTVGKAHPWATGAAGYLTNFEPSGVRNWPIGLATGAGRGVCLLTVHPPPE